MLTEIESLTFSVSHTTRKKREGEQEGKDYYFISTDRFERMVKEGLFIEWAEVHGNHYGTSKSELKKETEDGDLLLDIDVQGAAQIKEKNIDATFVFILPPLFPELRKRLETRGKDSLPVILKRLENAREEIQHYKEFDYIVINDELDTAAEELKSVLMSQRYRRESREKEIVPILRSFVEGE
jgi:guanylate kinase